MTVNVLRWLDDANAFNRDKTAIVDSDSCVTYGMYHDKAIGIAAEIIHNGLNKKPVVVYLEKSAKVLVSFMGVAYSGCFYSPIDVDMPKQRIDMILNVLEPELVITSNILQPQFEQCNYHGKFLIYDNVESIEHSELVSERVKGIIDTDLLYVLFTSGSTGVPKGVCATHKGVISYIDWIVETFDITQNDRFGNQCPFYFSMSVLDIYSALKSQASIYIIPKILFPQAILLLEYIRDNGITTIYWTPSGLSIISRLKALGRVDIKEILKRVLFAGEVMQTSQLNIWKKHLPNTIFANLYGPTEITDICTYYVLDRDLSDSESVPIGIPAGNFDIMVLDNNDRLVTEQGVSGELCVRGTCLSPGYYGNPDKTKEVFVQNPLNDSYEEKIYRTGDIVQYNQYGELIYMNRKDYQVQHMGYRIELGEIETAVSAMDNSLNCCCVYDDKHRKIVLFVDKELTLEDTNKRLSENIPKYMLPNKLIVLKDIPLNANGKMDRLALSKDYIK